MSPDDPGATADSNVRLAAAFEAADLVGAWEWSAPQDRVLADPRTCRLHGVAPEDGARGLPLAALTAAVHPDDRPALDTALHADGPFAAEYRLLPPGGEPRWVLARGRATRDAAGRPARALGLALDVTDRKGAEAARAAGEREIRTLSDALPQILWSAGPDGRLDGVNRRWHDLTGRADRAPHDHPWSAALHPEDREATRRRWHHALRTGEPYEAEMRLRAADGSWRWHLGRAEPLRDDDGRIIRWLGTCTDTHDARRIAEEREVLRHELPHRIKNIFAVVASLVGLAARRHPEAAAFAADIRGRVEALGHAHEFARPHTEEGAPDIGAATLFHFLRRLMAPYAPDAGDTSGDRLRTEGRDRPFDDGAATPLALLFHELGTNAAKFGAFSDPAGRVTVAAREEGDDLILTWREEGGPPVPGPPGREGFGSQIAAMAVRGQLGGDLQRFWHRHGLEVELRMPVRSLRRRHAGLGRRGVG